MRSRPGPAMTPLCNRRRSTAMDSGSRRRTRRDGTRESESMERATVQIYEQHAADWRARRAPRFRDHAATFAARCPAGAVRLDVGSGPGSYLPDLGRPAIALDAAFAMVALG